MLRLKNKTAIVTGASQGTGEAIAKRFVAEGANVVIADVKDEAGQALAESLDGSPEGSSQGAHRGKAHYVHLDVTSESDWANAVAFTQTTFGEPTILVNNAAILYLGPLETTSRETIDQITAVNQIGPMLGIQAVLPAMKAAGYGSIVNIGSIDGVTPGNHGIMAYSASKWALRGVTKVAALELGQYGIRVNIVNPDAGNPLMSKPFVPAGVSDQQIIAGAQAHVTKVLKPTVDCQRVDEITNMVLFLASDESSACSGGDYPVDAGYSAGHMM